MSNPAPSPPRAAPHGQPRGQPKDPGLEYLIDQAVALTPRRGRPGGPAPTILREIGEEDAAELLVERRDSLQRQPLERLRTTHHLAARELAQGKPNVEVALITGYSPQRISDLLADPTFRELVAHYKSQVEAKWLNVQERLAALGLALTEELQHRLETAPEGFTNEDLRRWAETTLDRAGVGPSKNLNVKHADLTASLIEKIKREAEGGGDVRLLAAE